MHAPIDPADPADHGPLRSTQSPPVLRIAVFGPRNPTQQLALQALQHSGQVHWSAAHPADAGAGIDQVIVTAGPGLLATLRTLDVRRPGMPPTLVLGPGDGAAVEAGLLQGSQRLGVRRWLDPRLEVTRLLDALRAERPASAARLGEVRLARIGAWELDLVRGYLHSPRAAHLLRGASLAVLTRLCRQAGSPVSRVALAQEAYGDPSALRTRAVDATVVRLRRLIEPDPSQPRHILTVRAVGYLLNTPSLETLE